MRRNNLLTQKTLKYMGKIKAYKMSIMDEVPADKEAYNAFLDDLGSLYSASLNPRVTIDVAIRNFNFLKDLEKAVEEMAYYGNQGTTEDLEEYGRLAGALDKYVADVKPKLEDALQQAIAISDMLNQVNGLVSQRMKEVEAYGKENGLL